MFYREAGDFKTSYKADSQTFPIKFDRYRYYVVLFVAFALIPLVINDYWVNAIFMPFLIYSIAAIGLNILVGYCGQVSLGTGGFMAVGAYAVYKLMTAFPEVNIFFHVILAGGITAFVGVLFGLPSRFAGKMRKSAYVVAKDSQGVYLFSPKHFDRTDLIGDENDSESGTFGLAGRASAGDSYSSCHANLVHAGGAVAQDLARTGDCLVRLDRRACAAGICFASDPDLRISLYSPWRDWCGCLGIHLYSANNLIYIDFSF
mgnify:CR=1 FL=1